MSIQLEGVITSLMIKPGKLQIFIDYVDEDNEERKAVLIPGIRLIEKISKKIGKSTEAWDEGLINKKIDITIE